MESWWTKAKIEEAVAAWGPMAGRFTSPEIDDRFRKEIGTVGPAERALVMGWRLAVAHGHCEANQTPGPFGAIWALKAGFPAQWLPEGPLGVEISSIREHVTCTGRLRWTARDDGTILIEVWRGPSAGSDAHIVLSALLRADARNDQYNYGMCTECVEVEGHAPFGVRHVDAIVSAIGWAMGPDYSTFEDEAIRARIAALGTPEPDPWDPVFRPEPIPAGSKVRFDLGSDYGIATGEATGEAPEWGQYERSWGQWIKADQEGNRWFVPVDDITSIEGGA